jgi:hypothetical protein
VFRTTVSKSRAGAVVFLLAALGGCNPEGKNTISGKVTRGGQPVAGTVAFVDDANKEYASPIGPDGTYQVLNLPTGHMRILVRGNPAPARTALTAVRGRVPGGKLPELPGGAVVHGGVVPDKKYATPNGGLDVSVTGGDQTHDVELE